jgi:TP901 family phage tail tape measure protein
MPKIFESSFVLGASLSSAFTATFGKAVSQVNQFGVAIKKAEGDKANIDRFRALKSGVESTKREMAMARQRAAELKRELASTEKPTKKMKTEMAAAARKVHSLEQKLKTQRSAMSGLKRDLDRAGISTRNLAGEQNRLAASFNLAKKNRDGLVKAMARSKEIRNKRTELRGQMLDAAAPVAALSIPIKLAVDFESAMADVNKVVDTEATKGLDKDILSMSTSIPMAVSGIAAIVEAAGQSGLAKTREELSGFALDSAKMGVAFDLAGKDAGEMMTKWRAGMGLNREKAMSLADAVNHLSNNMNAQAKGIGGVLQRQGAVGIAAGLTEIQVASLSAALLSGGATEEVAATAFKNLTNAMTRGGAATKDQKDAFEELGFSAEEMAERMQKDAPAAIKDLFKALNEAPKEDQSALMSRLFGEESKGAIAPLLANMENLNKAFELTADKLQYAGSMQKEYDVRSKTTANALKLLGNRGARLGVSFGTVLLPGLNAALAPLGVMGDMAAWVAESFPGISAGVMGVGVGLAGLGLVINAGAYAWTFYSGAVAKAKLMLAKFKTASISAIIVEKAKTAATWASVIAQKAGAVATGIMTAAMGAWNAAFMASPIGWIVAGVGALVGLGVVLYKNWEPFRDLINGIWEAAAGVFGKVVGLAKYLPWFGKDKKSPANELAEKSKSLDKVVKRETGGRYDVKVAPEIHVAAGADAGMVRQAVDAGMGHATENLRKALDDIMAHERRLSYG